MAGNALEVREAEAGPIALDPITALEGVEAGSALRTTAPSPPPQAGSAPLLEAFQVTGAAEEPAPESQPWRPHGACCPTWAHMGTHASCALSWAGPQVALALQRGQSRNY